MKGKNSRSIIEILHASCLILAKYDHSFSPFLQGEGLTPAFIPGCAYIIPVGPEIWKVGARPTVFLYHSRTENRHDKNIHLNLTKYNSWKY